MKTDYKMTISRMTIDKLGIRLYDRVSLAIAELVTNSYDADATEVKIKAPMGELLAKKTGGILQDQGYFIEVNDNGIGMTPEEVNKFYLIVGAERRLDSRRGDESRVYKRKVTGKKGIGKLAPLGVCQKIEIHSSGGDLVTGKNEKGKTIEGYLTAHLELDRSDILSDTDATYLPRPGAKDGVVSLNRGTTIKLTGFEHRRVPKLADFERQLSQRFGPPSPNWKVQLIDLKKSEQDPDYSLNVGQLSIALMPDTQISFMNGEESNGDGLGKVEGPDGKVIEDLSPGFMYEDKFYDVTGWVGYAKQPYKDDLMAGIRIYCRGKLAAQTNVFNLKAGFTGEYDVRSYLVGQLNADWLDETEDLIRTDRQDILWSEELGQSFQSWGQNIVKKVGVLTRQPKKKRAWERFQEESNIQQAVLDTYPNDTQKEIRDKSLELAKIISQNTREEEFKDSSIVESIVDLSLVLGPHITLDQKLREAAESHHDPISVITGILKTARVAELSGFGRIAEDRIKVIRKVEELKDNPQTIEDLLQDLIQEAPWLIEPQWSPLTANQTFSTLRNEFQKYFKEQTGEDLILKPFSEGQKRADFVLSNQDNSIQIVEIKRPDHSLENAELDRIIKYIELMNEFLQDPGNEQFKIKFPEFHVTLVCDSIGLSGTHKTAFKGLKSDGLLTHINWNTFLLRTTRVHQDFLNEAERQRHKSVAKNQEKK